MKMKLFQVKARSLVTKRVIDFAVRAITQKEAQTEAKIILNKDFPSERFSVTVKGF